MQTIVLNEPFRFDMKDAEKPVPGPGEAVVRVRCVGVCGTDLHAFEGTQPYFTYPRILGHELSVEVVEVGADAKVVRPGDCCVVNPYLECGRCIACRKGKPNCCRELKVLGVHVDGGMAEYMVLPQGKLIPADRLAPEVMALVENQCIGAHAVRRARVREGEFVLVIGLGPIGLAVIRFARLKGARIIAMDLRGDRLDFCRNTFDVEHIVNARENPDEALRHITSDDYPTAVFDATGSAASMKKAMSYVAHGGRLVLVGLVQDDLSFSDPEFHKREMTLLSSRNALMEDFEYVIRDLEENQAEVKPLITHRADFDKMIEAFPKWLDPDSGVVKAVVNPADRSSG